MTLQNERLAIANTLHAIDWESSTVGFLQCPGQHLHTTPNAPKDCRITLNDDRPPTIYCLHSSCQPAVETANKTLRQKIGSVEREVERGPVRPGRQYHISTASPGSLPLVPLSLPTPLPDGTQAHIAAAFQTGEMYCAGLAAADGSVRTGGTTHSVGDLPPEWPHGTFVRVNPMREGGTKDADVTAYRHALLEGDKSAKEVQWAAILSSGLPCSVVVDSGNKSLHAWVRVDAADAQQYRLRAKQAAAALMAYEGMAVDEACLNPGRFSRLAGCPRGDSRQELLAVNIGARSWEEWEAKRRSVLARTTTTTKAREDAAGVRTVDRVEIREEYGENAPLANEYGFHRSSRGTLVASLGAIVRVLTEAPQFRGRIWQDAFLQRVLTNIPEAPESWAAECESATPMEWGRRHTGEVTVWIQDAFGLPALPTAMVDEAVGLCASRQRRNCLQEWLTALQWDGEPRMADLMWRGFGTVRDEYHQRVGECWVLSMVARGLTPGCKVDTMPVFEGQQGIGKSTALGILGGVWFSEIHEDFGSKDFYLALQGKWLVEVSEMHAFNRSDVERLKGILSTRVDRYRAPYARLTEEMPRQSVFAGTTNRDDWQADETGARRFWPVLCGAVDLEWLRESREQLFAEAVSRFRAGEDWHTIPQEEAQAQQRARRPEDSWESILQDWLEGKEHRDFSAADILGTALELTPSEQTTGAARRVASILRRLGWVRFIDRDKRARYRMQSANA